jgi:hypothetical protein
MANIKRQMKHTFFQKESVGLNPFASQRDWAIFAALIFVLAALFIGFWRWTSASKGLVQAMSIGALVGMLPSLVLTLPVRGMVPRSQKERFLVEIARFRFVVAHEEAVVAIYVFPAPWWAKWDSKRVVIQELEDGDYLATIPLYVFRKLNAAA